MRKRCRSLSVELLHFYHLKEMSLQNHKTFLYLCISSSFKVRGCHHVVLSHYDVFTEVLEARCKKSALFIFSFSALAHTSIYHFSSSLSHSCIIIHSLQMIIMSKKKSDKLFIHMAHSETGKCTRACTQTVVK